MPQVAAVEPAEKDARCGSQAGRNHILAVRPARRAMECRRGTVAIAATEAGNQRGRDPAAGRDHPPAVACPRRLRPDPTPPPYQLPPRLALHLVPYYPRPLAPRPPLYPCCPPPPTLPQPPF